MSKPLDAKDEVSFYQAVKARLVKFDKTSGTGKTDEEIETAIRQVIDSGPRLREGGGHLRCRRHQKAEISILSEEFLLEIKAMKHKTSLLRS